MTINIEAKTLSKAAKGKGAYSVTLHGQVETVEISNVPPSSVSIVVKLKLELLNDGMKPVIFLKEKALMLVGYALTKSPSEVSSDNQLAFSFTGPAVDTSQEWAIFRDSLNQPSPPSDKIHILMPGETWRFDDSVHVYLSTEAGNKSTFPKNASWEAVQELPTVWLRVIYQAWPLNLEPVSNDRAKLSFGRKLQKRWKDVGLLWLDGIRSEPITLDLRNSKR